MVSTSTTGIGISPATPDQMAKRSTSLLATSPRSAVEVGAVASLCSGLAEALVVSAMAYPFSTSLGGGLSGDRTGLNFLLGSIRMSFKKGYHGGVPVPSGRARRSGRTQRNSHRNVTGLQR